MPNRALLTKVIDEVLAPDAWRRENTVWYLASDDIILLVNLERSRSPGRFEIGLGIFIRPDASDETVRTDPSYISWQTHLSESYDFTRDFLNGKSPKQHHCHVRTDLLHVIPNPDEVNSALDLGIVGIPEDRRARIISNALAEDVVAMFRRLKSLDDLRGMYTRRLIEHPRWIIPLDICHFLARNSNQTP